MATFPDIYLKRCVTTRVRVYYPPALFSLAGGADFVVSGLLRDFLRLNFNVELVYWKGKMPIPNQFAGLKSLRLPGGSNSENSVRRIYRALQSLLSSSSSPEQFYYPRELVRDWSDLEPADLAIYHYGFSWNWLSLGRNFGPTEESRIVYHHNLESDLSLQRAKDIGSFFHRINHHKLFRHELQLQNLVDENWFISEPDLKEWIQRGGNPAKASLHFPDIFEEDYVLIKNKRRYHLRNPQAPTLGFLGRLDFGPNAQGLSWILDRLCPSLATRNFTGKLRIVGKNASRHHIKKMSQFSFVQYEGFLSSLDNFWTELDWLLAPHLEGSGVRVKLIESLMYEIPTLTHLKAAERLSPTLRQSPYLHVVEDPSEWVTLLLQSNT